MEDSLIDFLDGMESSRDLGDIRNGTSRGQPQYRHNGGNVTTRVYPGQSQASLQRQPAVSAERLALDAFGKYAHTFPSSSRFIYLIVKIKMSLCGAPRIALIKQRKAEQDCRLNAPILQNPLRLLIVLDLSATSMV